MIDSKIRHVTIPGLRLHLRRGEPSLLWINGQNMLLLNDTAAEFIEAFIDVMSRYTSGLEPERFKSEVAAQIQKKYPLVPLDVLVKDFDNILIFYMPHPEGISVVRVLHAAQDWCILLGFIP